MAMRITNNMMVTKFNINLQNNLRKTNKFTQQLSTSRRIIHVSDDPVGVLDSLTARTRLADIHRYQDNLDKVKSWNDAADTALQQISSYMTRALEVMVQAANDGYGDQDRANIAAEMRGLKKSCMEALNTAVGEQYIFAGYNINNMPMTEGPGVEGEQMVLYNGVDLITKDNNGELVEKDKVNKEQAQQMQIETGYELMMDMSMTAVEVTGTGEKNLFYIIDNIINLMESDSATGTYTNPLTGETIDYVDEDGNLTESVADALGGWIDRLREAQENVTTCLARVGAEENRYEMLMDRYSIDELNYTEIKSGVEEIDAAETIMYWKMAEAVYNQSLAVGAKVIQPTLLDFLR